MYDHFDNITLIASGMGSGTSDNIIITYVYPNSVYYDLVAINGSDPNALGELYDYILLSEEKNMAKNLVNIYPSPVAGDYFYIENHLNTSLEYHLYHTSGMFISSGQIDYQSLERISTHHLPPGLYMITFQYNKVIFHKKIMIL